MRAAPANRVGRLRVVLVVVDEGDFTQLDVRQMRVGHGAVNRKIRGSGLAGFRRPEIAM